MLKVLQARLHQYMNHEIPDIQAGFRKGRGTRDQIANIRWIIEKARQFQEKKTSISAFLTMPKPLTVKSLAVISPALTRREKLNKLNTSNSESQPYS